MTLGKKSIAVLLAIVLIVLGLEFAVTRFIDLKYVKTRITTELAARLQADVVIQRIGLDVLPRPQLQLHGLQLVFADGIVLRVPLISLSPSLKGLFSGRPEIVGINLEKPDAQIALNRQEPDADNRTAEAQQEELVLTFKSALKAIPPCGVSATDGTVRITAPDGSLLALEKVEAATVVTSEG
jgi:uncharacterized protein involved in outer membrane biogenesis